MPQIGTSEDQANLRKALIPWGDQSTDNDLQKKREDLARKVANRGEGLGNKGLLTASGYGNQK